MGADLDLCEGKLHFDRLSLAAKAAKRKRGRHPYRCRTCQCWHVGSNPTTRPFGRKHSAR